MLITIRNYCHPDTGWFRYLQLAADNWNVACRGAGKDIQLQVLDSGYADCTQILYAQGEITVCERPRPADKPGELAQGNTGLLQPSWGYGWVEMFVPSTGMSESFATAIPAHELGHALGNRNHAPYPSVMGPTPVAIMPTADDVAAIWTPPAPQPAPAPAPPKKKKKKKKGKH